jgi:hypothetical protein
MRYGGKNMSWWDKHKWVFRTDEWYTFVWYVKIAVVLVLIGLVIV